MDGFWRPTFSEQKNTDGIFIQITRDELWPHSSFAPSGHELHILYLSAWERRKLGGKYGKYFQPFFNKRMLIKKRENSPLWYHPELSCGKAYLHRSQVFGFSFDLTSDFSRLIELVTRLFAVWPQAREQKRHTYANTIARGLRYY